MNHYLTHFCFLFLASNVCLSQDLIIRNDSSKIYCKITKVDSLKIYYLHFVDKKNLNDTINKSNVNRYLLAQPFNPIWHGDKSKKDNLDSSKNTPLCLKSKGQYLIAYISYDNLFNYSALKNISISFPFSTKDAITSLTTNDTLHIKSQDIFSEKTNFFSLNVEINLKKNIYNLHAGLTNNSYVLSAGYGKAFDINLFKKIKFCIKPLINLAYLKTSETISYSINNKNKYISVPNASYNPTFVYHYSSGSSKYGGTNVTKDADLLKMNYAYSSFNIIPQVSITNNRKNRVFVAFTFGCIIPVVYHSGIEFYQTGGGVTKDGSFLPFDDKAVNISSNGQKINRLSYKVFSPYVSFSFGFYLNK
jgi:hypothetical protein